MLITQRSLTHCLLLLFFLGSTLYFFACKKDNTSGGKPTITLVRLLAKNDTVQNVKMQVTLDSFIVNDVYNRVVAFDSTVLSGHFFTTYALIGNNLQSTSSITVNGRPIYFNPTYVTNQVIIFSITDTLVPTGSNVSNQLVVTTKNGSASFNFNLLQLPPSITSFSPLSASTGDTVTIVGTRLNGATNVKFGTTPATIVGTPTANKIKVLVPPNVSQANIFVSTPGGIGISPQTYGFAFKILVYDDSLHSAFKDNSYNSTEVYNSTTHVYRGTNAIDVTFTAQYGALQIEPSGAPLSISGAGISSIEFKAYGDPNTVKSGNQLQVYFNGNYMAQAQVNLLPGWNVYVIPISSVDPTLTKITNVAIQAGGSVLIPSSVWIDDIAFL